MMSGERSQCCARAIAQYGSCASANGGHAVQVRAPSLIDSGAFIFTFRGLVSLPHHLWSICDISGTFNSPDSASTSPCGLVGPPGAADTCRSHFQSSSATWWVRLVSGMYVVDGRWCRWPRYVHCIMFALLVLTCLVFSQRCRTDSF